MILMTTSTVWMTRSSCKEVTLATSGSVTITLQGKIKKIILYLVTAIYTRRCFKCDLVHLLIVEEQNFHMMCRVAQENGLHTNGVSIRNNKVTIFMHRSSMMSN